MLEGAMAAVGAAGGSRVLVSCSCRPGWVAPGRAQLHNAQGEEGWWEPEQGSEGRAESYPRPSISSDSLHGFQFSNLTFKSSQRYEVLEGMLPTHLNSIKDQIPKPN